MCQGKRKQAQKLLATSSIFDFDGFSNHDRYFVGKIVSIPISIFHDIMLRSTWEVRRMKYRDDPPDP